MEFGRAPIEAIESDMHRCPMKRLCQSMFARWFVVGVAPLGVAWLSGGAAGSDGAVAIREVDSRIQEVWSERGLEPSREAEAGEWCRRLYLDVLGRIPTVPEVTKYLQDNRRDKRQRLVEQLLYSEAHSSEYARYWSTIWTNLLIGRTGGTEADSLVSRPGMRQYLSDCFRRNKPYDQMVSELIAATGTTAPGSSHFNGATNFLVMKLSEKGVQATAKTAQLFMGTQVQCTQCHNHPFNDWKQHRFWELNAFSRQAVALRKFEDGSRMVREVELTDQDFAGESGNPDEAEIYYEERNGLLHVAYPVFLDGTPLANRSGYLSDVARRKELARLVTASPLLERAIVNRLWKHFLGYGFSEPVDDLGAHRQVSHPELLNWLASDLRQNDFDLKRLMRVIVLSRPYALASRPSRSNAADDPELGEPPAFSRFYLRQLSAEQLYESLLVATGAQRTGASLEEQESLKVTWLQQFSQAFGNDEEGESNTFNGTIPQALMMFNGELVQRATSLKSGGFLADVLSSRLRPAEKVDQLYLAALARKPAAPERRLVSRLFVANAVTAADSSPAADRESNWSELADPGASAMQDLWWALLNSNEFILNH